MIPRTRQAEPSFRAGRLKDAMMYSRATATCREGRLYDGDRALQERERERMESATGGLLTWRFDGRKAELVEVAR